MMTRANVIIKGKVARGMVEIKKGFKIKVDQNQTICTDTIQ